ncbi:hypothetical protein DFS33DRAFT_1278372 [Desarmillaria ectypa]|nr:hypothetical protein DFS33DRAFT_1278372 [Desarmillaria ectypa]
MTPILTCHISATLITISEENITTARGIIEGSSNADAIKMGKDAVRCLLAPCKDVIAVLEIFSEVHPAVKVIVQLHLDRQDNDKHIAALYFSMVLRYASRLVLSGQVFDDDDGLKDHLENHLEEICSNINAFGNFCDVYYKHKSVGKLEEFATIFYDHKSKLQFIVQQKSAVTITTMKSDLGNVRELLTYLSTKTSKEEEIIEMIRKHPGGEDAVINSVLIIQYQDDQMLSYIADKMGEKITSSMNELYNLKVEAAVSQFKEAVEKSAETILIHSTHMFTIPYNLNSGPHDLIMDDNIRAVWKASNGVSAAKYDTSLTTLDFMSKVISIGDAIDDDGSGYFSVHEVNNFFQNKPKSWSTPEWIAFWAVGWYGNTVIYKRRRDLLLDFLEDSKAKVLPENAGFLEEYIGEDCLEDVRNIVSSVYTDTLGYLGENLGAGYERLQELRAEYMDAEMKNVRSHLVRTKYRIDDPATVNVICGSQQIEQAFLGLLSVVLQQHRKIVELAQIYVLSDQEFATMRITITSLTTAYECRLKTLLECWRQQRLDIKLQVQSFASGLFENWWMNYWDSGSSEDDNEEGSGSDETDDNSGDGNDEEEEEDEDDFNDEEHFPQDEAPSEPSAVLIFPFEQPATDSKRDPPKPTKVSNHPEATGKIPGKQGRERRLEKRIAGMETKLEGIEKLLREVLATTKSNGDDS